MTSFAPGMGKEVWLGVQNFMAIMENGPHCLDNDVNEFLPSELYLFNSVEMIS